MLAPGAAQKFYPDDPLWREPKPLPVGKVVHRDLSDAYDVVQMTAFRPGRKPGPARVVNTLGEVPDTAWYQNRHSLTHRMSTAELVRGPDTDGPPATDQPWTVVSGKNTGVTPGLIIEDSRRHKYLLKFDPRENPSITTAADVISSKFFYALGYNVPENYVVRFGIKQLRLAPDAAVVDFDGKKHKMRPDDLTLLLNGTTIAKDGTYRAMASRFISGEIIGPFQYFGTRSDDPNDVLSHEHRRDLRGLYVFSAWLNHYDATCINTLDSVVEENGVRFIKHYLIDFGSTLGASALGPRVLRSGNAYFFDLPLAGRQIFTLGLAPSRWQFEHDPYFPELGEFGYETFDPRQWKPIYPNPAFVLRRPEDNYWAAKRVMAFSDADIRAIVGAGEYGDPKAAEWLVKCLIERRNRIGRVFLNDVLPLENLRFQNGKLEFDDLAVQFGFHAPRAYTFQWFRFDNASGRETDLPQARTPDLPRELASLPAGSYFGARIRSGERKEVTVYFRAAQPATEVVGIDRQY